MKKVFKFLPFLLFGLCFILNSCSDEDLKSDTDVVNSNKSIESQILLTNSISQLAFNGDITNPYFNYSENDSNLRLDKLIGSLNITDNMDGTVNISSENLPFSINIEEGDGNENGIGINYLRSDDLESKTINISNTNFATSSGLIDGIKDIGSIDLVGGSYETMACPPCVVIVIGIVVFAINDHCDTVVEEGTAACARGGNCADVSACSVNCHSCESDK